MSKPRIFIESVVAAPKPDEIAGFHLDAPTSGTTLESSGLVVSGWVFFHGGRACRLELVSDGPIAQIPVTNPRPDVAKTFFGKSAAATAGFKCQVGVSTLPPRFSVHVIAVNDQGARFRLATIHGRREDRRVTRNQPPNPLLVMGMGRSGTTWLMRLLSLHPAVVADIRYPYETRVAQYFGQVDKILSAPMDISRPDDRVAFIQEPDLIRRNPFFSLEGIEAQWFDAGYQRVLDDFVRASTIGYYELMAEQQSKRGFDFFAEKAFHARPTALDAVFPGTRRVWLVRDLRDVFCSARAFNSKRGVRHFGRENTDSDEAHIFELARRGDRFIQQWESAGGNGPLLRYEDLLRDPHASLTAVFDSLGIDNDAGTIGRLIRQAELDTQELKAHRTSKSPVASVSRWERDLEDKLQEECRVAFGHWIEAFGY